MTRSVLGLRILLVAAIAVACDSTPPRVATSISVNPGAPMTAMVASTITPGALVLDQDGQPLGGVTVTFAVTDGGGSIPGSKTSTTDDNGVAAVSGWTLGTVTGTNTMTAKTGELPAVTFNINATAATPTTVAKVGGDNTFAAAGTAVAVAPAVRVTDAHGNRVPDATVTFAIASGGGSLTGATATTDANGEAAVGSWTLGATNGANTITATVAGVAPVTFTATGVTRCTVAGGTAIAMGATINGAIESTDCAPVATQARYGDVYTFTLAAQTALTITASSSAVHPYVAVTNAAGEFIAESLDSEAGATTVTLRAIFPAGSYAIMATTSVAVETGAYSLSLATAAESVSECVFTWTARGISTNQSVALTDCFLQDGAGSRYHGDAFLLFLPSGSVLTVDMTSAAFDTWLDLFTAQGSAVASNDDISAANTNSRLVINVQTSNYYLLFPNTAFAQATGAYQLVIAAPSAPASVVSALSASSRNLQGGIVRGSAVRMARPLFLGGRLVRR